MFKVRYITYYYDIFTLYYDIQIRFIYKYCKLNNISSYITVYKYLNVKFQPQTAVTTEKNKKEQYKLLIIYSQQQRQQFKMLTFFQAFPLKKQFKISIHSDS